LAFVHDSCDKANSHHHYQEKEDGQQHPYHGQQDTLPPFYAEQLFVEKNGVEYIDSLIDTGNLLANSVYQTQGEQYNRKENRYA
jgi:hypothetical protein